MVESAGETGLSCGEEEGNKTGDPGLDGRGELLLDVCDDGAEVDSDGDGYESRAADGASDVVRVRREEVESPVGVRDRLYWRSSSVDLRVIIGTGG